LIYKEDGDYARGRLNNTFVKYKGELVFVEELWNTRFRYKTGLNWGKSLIGDTNNIDLSPIKLGYTNYKNRAHYLMRIPARRWKQGADKQGVTSVSTHYGDGTEVRGSDFRYTFKGDYPSLVHATKEAKEMGYPVAFSRVFAILPNMSLEYKGRNVVGKIDNYGRPLLDRKYLWLEEALRENV